MHNTRLSIYPTLPYPAVLTQSKVPEYLPFLASDSLDVQKLPDKLYTIHQSKHQTKNPPPLPTLYRQNLIEQPNPTQPNRTAQHSSMAQIKSNQIEP